jgi:anoctamin-10
MTHSNNSNLLHPIPSGYVLLFSPAFPLAALCALCNNLLEARVDAFKLCAVHRRPWPRAAQPTQEAWQSAIKVSAGDREVE